MAGAKSRLPSEQSEQVALARWLKRRGLLWFHHPAGGARPRRAGQALRHAGASRGWPDVLIFDPPPGVPSAVGTALELKRINGGGTSKAHLLEQCGRLDALALRGWCVAICWGWREAVQLLITLGY